MKKKIDLVVDKLNRYLKNFMFVIKTGSIIQVNKINENYLLQKLEGIGIVLKLFDRHF